MTKRAVGPVLFHSLRVSFHSIQVHSIPFKYSPFHSSSIPFLCGIFLPIFTTFFETAIALEVASGDSFVAGTEPDNLPIIWQAWEHEPDTEPDKSFLYYIMWELLSSDLVIGAPLSELPYSSLVISDWHGKPVIGKGTSSSFYLRFLWESVTLSSILSCALYWDILSYLCFSHSSHSL